VKLVAGDFCWGFQGFDEEKFLTPASHATLAKISAGRNIYDEHLGFLENFDSCVIDFDELRRIY
jgi:hypothetical protein